MRFPLQNFLQIDHCAAGLIGRESQNMPGILTLETLQIHVSIHFLFFRGQKWKISFPLVFCPCHSLFFMHLRWCSAAL